MGPFPHDAPPARISAHNPAGTDGFEFVEFAHPEPDKLETLFGQMGYVEVARHKTRRTSRSIARAPSTICSIAIRTAMRRASSPSMARARPPWRGAWSTPGMR